MRTGPEKEWVRAVCWRGETGWLRRLRLSAKLDLLDTDGDTFSRRGVCAGVGVVEGALEEAVMLWGLMMGLLLESSGGCGGGGGGDEGASRPLEAGAVAVRGASGSDSAMMEAGGSLQECTGGSRRRLAVSVPPSVKRRVPGARRSPRRLHMHEITTTGRGRLRGDVVVVVDHVKEKEMYSGCRSRKAWKG